MRRIVLTLVALGLPLIAWATPAGAGGWALVTLDSPLLEVRAGEPLSLGFMVRQHGVTPIDYAFDERQPTKPVLTARNLSTKGAVSAEARKEGPVGHFVVDVTFQSAGTWEWEITPPPFAGTRLPALTVLTASGEHVTPAAAAADEAKIAAQTTAPAASAPAHARPDPARAGMVILAGALTLCIAVVLTRRRLQSHRHS